MPAQPDVKPDWEGKDVVWFPSAPEGFATYFTVLYTASDITARNLEITWQTADGLHRYTAHSIWRAALANGQTVWVVKDERPMPEAEKEGLRQFKQQWVAATKQALGAERFSAMYEPRFYLWGYDSDGTRFYIDASCTPA